MTITVSSFGGHALDSGDYRAFLLADAFQRSGEHVTVKPPGSWPRSVRVELRERAFGLQVQLQPGVTIQDAHDELAGWFAVGTEADLVVDFDGTDRTLTCVVVDARPYEPYTGVFTAILVAVDARWKNTSLQTVTTPITASGQTFALVNDGTATIDDAVITITPTSAKSAANGWRYLREVVVAWRATRASSGAYPLEVTEGWDHAAEVSAGRSLATGDDVRVLVDGVEVPRWWGSHANTDPNSAASTLWIAPAFSPRRTFTLLSAITAGSPANGDDLEVAKGGTLGWPATGAFVLDDEVFEYTGRTESNENGRAAFTGITRAARTSTAATHSASTTGYWLEHRIQIVYGYTSATAPDARADLEPMLDRSDANLSNTRWIWANFRDSRYPGRAAQWQRVYRGLDGRATRILAADGAPLVALVHEYQADGAQAGKPNFDTWRMPLPAGGTTSGTLLSATHAVSDTLALLLTGTDDDGAEFSLSEVSGPVSSSGLTVAAPTRAVYEVLARTRSQVTNGVVVGSGQFTLLNSGWSHQQWTVHGNGYIKGVDVYLIPDSVNRNISGNGLHADNGSNVPADTTPTVGGSEVFTFTGTGSGGVTQWKRLPVPSSGSVAVLPLFDGQKWWTSMLDASGTVAWGTGSFVYPDGISYENGAAVNVAFKFRVISTELDFQEGIEADDGDTTTLDAVDIRLDSAGVPYVNALSRVDRYWLRGVEVENVSTGQVITLSALCSLNDSIEIDVAAASARNVTTGEYVAGGALEFSDPAGRLELAPGSNTLKFTEAGLVAVTVDVDYRSRWQ